MIRHIVTYIFHNLDKCGGRHFRHSSHYRVHYIHYGNIILGLGYLFWVNKTRK